MLSNVRICAELSESQAHRETLTHHHHPLEEAGRWEKQGEGEMGLGWSYRHGQSSGPQRFYQTGWLRQALSCRGKHVPGSVMEIGKYKSLGFKMPGFWGRRGSRNLQSDLNCLRPSEMYKTEMTMVVSWGPETVRD